MAVQSKVNVVVAGRGTIGKALIAELLKQGHDVLCAFTSRKLFRDSSFGSVEERATLDITSADRLAEVLDPYCVPVEGSGRRTAEVAFIAIPSSGKGEDEMRLIRYFLSKGLYVITFAKGAFAYHYDELAPDLGRIGRNAVVGGRSMILPFLRMNHLRGKPITLHGVVNASLNMFMDLCSGGSSTHESFRTVQAMGLAEPGSGDVVSFVNGELRDVVLKTCVVFNEGLAPHEGHFITPDDLPPLVPVTQADLKAMTLPSKNLRMIVRITNAHRLPLEHEDDSPGSMFGDFGGYEFSLGFYDLGHNTVLSNWVQGGAWNGMRIQHDGGVEGPLTIGGLGAGPGPTVGAAMCDLQAYLQTRII